MPRRIVRRTPLRDWQARRAVEWSELARRAGLSIRTVMRAAAGEVVSDDAAAALERETGLVAATWSGAEQ